MALAFIVEDGSAVTGATAYVSVSDLLAYYALHPYASVITAASTPQLQAAIVMASRMINASVLWKGAPINHTQGLQWPRQGVTINYNLDLSANPILGYENTTYPTYMLVPPDIVPDRVKDAVCEYCRYILAIDRDLSKDKSIEKRKKVGPIEVEYFENTAKDFLPEPVIRFLRDYITEAPSSNGAASASRAVMRRS